MGSRSCRMLSRSRTVTARSSRDWKSTVTQNRRLDRRQVGMELQQRSPLGLARRRRSLLLAIGIQQEGQQGPVHPRRGLDDVRVVAPVGFLLVIAQVLAGGFGAALQIEVGA